MNKVAILQSNYIPWKGYFDIIHDVDLFIFYDDVQYTTADWRNRNKIYTQHGSKWLSIPAGSNKHRLVLDVRLENKNWQKDHYNTISGCYKRAPYYEKYESFIKEIYLENEWDYLYQLNRFIIERISKDFLGIKTKFGDSRDFETQGVKHERLFGIVKSAGADIYVSGPAAKDYIREDDYTAAGIELVWKDYSGYPQYPQLHETFEHSLSILDLLFNVGDEAPYYIWGWRENK